MDINSIFTEEVINHYKANKNLITSELLDKLRSFGERGKDIALEILDTEKSNDNYYLDAFGEKISNNGNRNQKKAFTQMKLSKIHLIEIEKCKNDLMYFKDNYVKILTKSGYSFPETRPYQEEFLKDMIDDTYENIVSLQGRQCCSAETEITVNNQKITMKDLFDDSENTKNSSLNEKFTESFKCNNKKVLTPLGFKEIEYVHKTIPYEKYRIKTENGFILECAEKHVLILEDGKECYAKDSLNKSVQTVNGISKIIECTDLGYKEAMYDISIKEDTELYFSNGILSHNSGKSITVSIYLAHKFNFGSDMNIGICANKGPLAREFLNNVKNIFEALPMWLRVGVTVWNKGSIESESKMRILTDVPGQNAFRGFTCAILVIDECAFIKANVWKEMEDSVFPSQSALGWKKNIVISTPNGINHFKNIVDGAKKGTNGFKYHFVNWRDVPRYDTKGNKLTPEQFKEKTVKKHGEKFFLQNFACVEYNSKINIFDTLNNKELEISIGDFYNNKLPSNRFKVLTSEGFSDFEGIRKIKVDKTLKITLEDNNQIEVSENHIFIIQSKNIKANTLKIGDYLEVKNNVLKRILNIEIKNEQKDVFDIIETKNHSYFANNILNHNCSFVGSSLTLVSPEILESLTPSNYEYLRDSRLKIYKEPEKNHIYFLAVDGAKSGEDALTVQIVDLSKKPFEQVASAQLFKCNFQKMPVFIDEWGRLYNTALVIVENNEGAGTYIASVLKINYDYPNLFYEKKKKEEPGFRTTVKTRPQILDILKLFLDNKLLILHDEETIKELGTFISKNGKYQAENGFHDDLIMCLAVLFAPFCDTKNFDDITKVIESLYSESENSENLLSNHLVIGNFDTEDDESFEMSKKFENDFDGFAEFDDYSENENDYFDGY